MRWMLLLLVLLPVTSLRAQEPATEPKPILVSAVGTEALRGLLNLEGIEPLSQATDLILEPHNTILIVLGRMDPVVARDLKRFVSQGGSVLIANDVTTMPRGGFNEPWADDLGIGIADYKLMSSRVADSYNDADFCPLLDPNAFPDRFEDPDSPANIVRDLDRIATNNPSHLFARRVTSMQPFVGFHRSIRNRSNPQALLPRQMAVFGAASRDWPDEGSGRVIVLADHSVFNNELMLPEAQNTDNFAFAWNCIRWLQSDPPRKKCLFYEDGKVQKNFNVTFVEIPPPPLPPLPVLANMLMQHGNRIIAQLEDKDFFNQAVTRRWNYGRFLRGFVLVLTILLGCYGLVRLWRARTRVDSLIPATLGFSAERLKKRNSLETRQNALFDRDNLYESASVFVRDRFAALGLVPNAKGKPPRWNLTGTFFRKRRIHHQLRKLWRVAYGSKPMTITSARWLKMASELEQLENDYDRGRWSVESIDEGTA